MLSVICCARKGSIRLPGKNIMILGGKPLILHTIELMVYLKQHIAGKYVVVTDCHKCKKIAEMNAVQVLWETDQGEWSGMVFNRWIHENIKADRYILLQPTSPKRDRMEVLRRIGMCVDNNIHSAFAVYRNDRKNYVMSGSFFYYDKKQLQREDLIDTDSIVFIDDIMLDIDTKEDFEEAKRYYEN